MMKIGVIGATSQLGKHLVSALGSKPEILIAGYRDIGKVPAPWRRRPNLSCVPIELQNPLELLRTFKNSEVIIWLAHHGQYQPEQEQIRVNLQALEAICAHHAEIGFRRIVYISSGGSVYGEALSIPIHENHPRRPISPYGKTKKKMEDLLCQNSDKFDVVILRPGNIYAPESFQGCGPGVFAAYYRAIKENCPFTLIAEGQAVRDFVYVLDVVQAIQAAIAIPAKGKAIIWNVATGHGTPIIELIKIIAPGTDAPELIYIPKRPHDVSCNILSPRSIQQATGWRPPDRLSDMIQQHALSLGP